MNESSSSGSITADAADANEIRAMIREIIREELQAPSIQQQFTQRLAQRRFDLGLSAPSQPLGGQYGDVHMGSTQLIQLTDWTFTPEQIVGETVTNVTGGFKGQIMGAVGGSGTFTLLVPASGYSTPPTFGATPTLNLYADAAKVHGFVNMPIALTKTPVKSMLSGKDGIRITFNFNANGPYNATGAFAILGSYNDEITSSSGT